MTDRHPLYYRPQPSGLRLDFRDGSTRHVASTYLQCLVSADGCTCDLYYATAVVRIAGKGLRAILEGLENIEHPLGNLAGISERIECATDVLPPGPGQHGREVTVTSIKVDDRLEPFAGGEDQDGDSP